MHSEEWLKSQQMAAIEAPLAVELNEARERYDRAKAEFDLALSQARDIGLNRQDGAFAVRTATRKYNLNLEHYHEALVRFSDFILRGKIPRDPN